MKFTFEIMLDEYLMVPIEAAGTVEYGIADVRIDMYSDMGRKFTAAGLTREHVEKVLDALDKHWRQRAVECACDNIDEAANDAAEAKRDAAADARYDESKGN